MENSDRSGDRRGKLSAKDFMVDSREPVSGDDYDLRCLLTLRIRLPWKMRSQREETADDLEGAAVAGTFH